MGIIYSSFYQTLANKNHLLDVGCGEGALSDLFLGPNAHHYHGIDVSKVAIEKAKIKRPHFDFGLQTSWPRLQIQNDCLQ